MSIPERSARPPRSTIHIRLLPDVIRCGGSATLQWFPLSHFPTSPYFSCSFRISHLYLAGGATESIDRIQLKIHSLFGCQLQLHPVSNFSPHDDDGGRWCGAGLARHAFGFGNGIPRKNKLRLFSKLAELNFNACG